MFYSDKIKNKIETLLGSNLEPEEKEVLKYIIEHDRVSQAELAQLVEAGNHKIHEEHLKSNDTTLRQIRQIIRNLRVRWHAPILSDRQGYWIPKTEEEVLKYLTKLERTAMAQAKAHMITYNAMKQTFNVQSSFFDGQVTEI